MISLCPTVTAADSASFQSQMSLATSLSRRVHLDVADGQLAPRQLLPLADSWWPGGVRVDIHVMYQHPLEHLAILLALKPQLVIVHAEADGDFLQLSNQLRAHGIEAGIALLPQTPVAMLTPALNYIDHVLIFSGNLGYQGGSTADLSLLPKVAELRQLKPQLEIGWDGGVTDQNIGQLAQAGVDVANVGGYVQSAADPQAAWRQLWSAAQAEA